MTSTGGFSYLRYGRRVTGTEQFLERGLETPGLWIVDRNKISLGVGVHFDALHLGLVHEDVEGGLGERLVGRFPIAVHAGPVGAADSSRSWTGHGVQCRAQFKNRTIRTELHTK